MTRVYHKLTILISKLRKFFKIALPWLIVVLVLPLAIVTLSVVKPAEAG